MNIKQKLKDYRVSIAKIFTDPARIERACKEHEKQLINIDKLNITDKDLGLNYTDADERRMNIIGQNGNSGEHYSE